MYGLRFASIVIASLLCHSAVQGTLLQLWIEIRQLGSECLWEFSGVILLVTFKNTVRLLINNLSIMTLKSFRLAQRVPL